VIYESAGIFCCNNSADKMRNKQKRERRAIVMAKTGKQTKRKPKCATSGNFAKANKHDITFLRTHQSNKRA